MKLLGRIRKVFLKKGWIKTMKRYFDNYMIKHPVSVQPMMEIEGFLVRPGMFDLNGATE